MLIYCLGSDNQKKLTSKHPLPLGPDLRLCLARTGRGLWSLHVFGLAWEAALISQGDTEIRAVTFHSCQGLKHLYKGTCMQAPLYFMDRILHFFLKLLVN